MSPEIHGFNVWQTSSANKSGNSSGINFLDVDSTQLAKELITGRTNIDWRKAIGDFYNAQSAAAEKGQNMVNSPGNERLTKALNGAEGSRSLYSSRSGEGNNDINAESYSGKKGISKENAEKNLDTIKNDYLKKLGFTDDEIGRMKIGYDKKTGSLFFSETLNNCKTRFIKPLTDEDGKKSVGVTEVSDDGKNSKSVETAIDDGTISSKETQNKVKKDQEHDMSTIDKILKQTKNPNELSQKELKDITHEIWDMENKDKKAGGKGQISSEYIAQLNKLPSSVREQVNKYMNEQKKNEQNVPNFRFDEDPKTDTEKQS